MNNRINLNQYHHLVILSDNSQDTINHWAKAFGFSAPKNHATGPVYEKFLTEKYLSDYRGQRWVSDFYQAVFNQPSMFFEIDGMGNKEDCFTEFYRKHRNGVCYIGFVLSNKKNDFIAELKQQYNVDIIVDQEFPGGDWTVVETENLLGCNLCLKASPGGDHTDHPLLKDFAGALILCEENDQKKESWSQLFDLNEVTEYENDGYRSVVLKSDRFEIHLLENRSISLLDVYKQKHANGIIALITKEDEIPYPVIFEDDHYQIYDSIDDLATYLVKLKR